jgi:hypothetical protein
VVAKVSVTCHDLSVLWPSLSQPSFSCTASGPLSLATSSSCCACLASADTVRSSFLQQWAVQLRQEACLLKVMFPTYYLYTVHSPFHNLLCLDTRPSLICICSFVAMCALNFGVFRKRCFFIFGGNFGINMRSSNSQ